MIQLKLKLNSKKPATVYAVNGKTYFLNPGSNILNLEYDDYISLAKALSIKPVENKKASPAVGSELEKKVDNESAAAKEASKKESNPEEKVETSAKDEPTPVESTVEDPSKGEVPTEEPAEEAADKALAEDAESEAKAEDTEEADYSTWTLKQLKSAYRELTGETCKLKKDEVIAFLQEHHA